jgi:hypothetical protein
MKVVALKPGYLGKLRQPGDEFDVPEGSKASWFVPVVDVEPEFEPPVDAANASVLPPAEKPKQRQRGGPLADLV